MITEIDVCVVRAHRGGHRRSDTLYEGGRSGVKDGLSLLVLTIILVIVGAKFAKEASDFVKDMKVKYNKSL